MTHTPFYDPDSTTRHAGEAVDCTTCRAWLLDSFRTDPRTPQVPKNAGGPNGCPFCTTSQNPDLRDHVRNCHPEQFDLWSAAQDAVGWPQVTSVPASEWFRAGQARPHPSTGGHGDPFTHSHPEHDVQSGVNARGHDGMWFAMCGCGWQVHGHFEPSSSIAVIRAVQRSRDAGMAHTQHPDDTPPIDGACQ